MSNSPTIQSHLRQTSGVDNPNDFQTPGHLVVPESALVWTFARSSGAGGQHVNKTSSKAILTVVVNDVIGPPEKIDRLRNALDEEIRIIRQTSRSQWRNRQLCLTELAAVLDEAAAPAPSPRRKSRPTRGSIERRLTSKRKDSEKKTLRRTKDW